MDGPYGRGGALELGLELQWTISMGAEHVMRNAHGRPDRAELAAAVLGDWDALPDRGYQDLPVRGGATIARHWVPSLGGFRVFDEPHIIDWCSVRGKHYLVSLPSFNTGGWYDVFIEGTLDNFEAMTKLRRDARLIVGPWSHLEFGDSVGDLRFGLVSCRVGPPVHPHGDALTLFRYHLEDSADIQLPAARVRIFVMGRNEWRDENKWPLASARVERHFLRADGRLTISEPAADDPVTEFVYDPADPVPTVGGQTVMFSGYPSGPKDQAAIEARDDVCVFTSDILDKEIEVTGRIRVILHGISSAPSTAWVARLCDVHPDGRSFNLCDSIVRVDRRADRHGVQEIDLWSTSNVFLAGYRIRVHITSSSFPRWDRNLNTGNQNRAKF